MNEIKYPYKKQKIYIRLAIIILSLTIILAALLTTQKNALLTIIMFIICTLLVVLYSVYKIVNIKSIAYFIKWDSKGVYTMESFLFCPWNKIKSISLQRYLGYQTIFFEISEEIESKMNPIHRNGIQYYCLPLADCKGKPQEIVDKLNAIKISK